MLSPSDAVLLIGLIPAASLLLLLLTIATSLCCFLRMSRRTKAPADVESVPHTHILRDTWQYIAGPSPPTYAEACVQDGENAAAPEDTGNNDASENDTGGNDASITSTANDEESTDLNRV